MIKPIHFSKEALFKSKGQLSLPQADAKELLNAHKIQLNQIIATILTQKGRNNA